MKQLGQLQDPRNSKSGSSDSVLLHFILHDKNRLILSLSFGVIVLSDPSRCSCSWKGKTKPCLTCRVQQIRILLVFSIFMFIFLCKTSVASPLRGPCELWTLWVPSLPPTLTCLRFWIEFSFSFFHWSPPLLGALCTLVGNQALHRLWNVPFGGKALGLASKRINQYLSNFYKGQGENLL